MKACKGFLVVRSLKTCALVLAGGCEVQGASGALDGLRRFCRVAQWLPGTAAHLRAGPPQGQSLVLLKRMQCLKMSLKIIEGAQHVGDATLAQVHIYYTLNCTESTEGSSHHTMSLTALCQASIHKPFSQRQNVVHRHHILPTIQGMSNAFTFLTEA